MTTRTTIAALAACFGLALQPAFALGPLKDVDYVREGIIDVGIAYELSERCESLNARLFAGLGFLNSLKNHARGLGYSNAEIDAYVNDEAEKDRLEAIARERLVAMGAIPGDAASHCAVGRAQIAANTRVGSLLR